MNTKQKKLTCKHEKIKQYRINNEEKETKENTNNDQMNTKTKLYKTNSRQHNNRQKTQTIE